MGHNILRQVRTTRGVARKLNAALAEQEKAAETSKLTGSGQRLADIRKARAEAARLGVSDTARGPYSHCSPADWAVLLCLADHATEDVNHGTVRNPGGSRKCFLLVETIADETLLSVRQVRRSLARLAGGAGDADPLVDRARAAAPVIRIKHRKNRSSVFTVLDPVTAWHEGIGDAGLWDLVDADDDEGIDEGFEGLVEEEVASPGRHEVPAQRGPSPSEQLPDEGRAAVKVLVMHGRWRWQEAEDEVREALDRLAPGDRRSPVALQAAMSALTVERCGVSFVDENVDSPRF